MLFQILGLKQELKCELILVKDISTKRAVAKIQQYFLNNRKDPEK